jgi:hypothetical protein
MKRSHKAAAGIVAALSLGVAAAAFAQPGPMGDGSGQHGKMGGMQHGAMGHGSAGKGAAQSRMTSEERTARHEKMRNAQTPEERQHCGPRAGATSESNTHTH